MKELALVGTTCHVYSEVLSKLLESGVVVNALLTDPERLMVNNELMTKEHLDPANEEAVEKALSGLHDAVLVYDDNLRNVEHNELTLKSFVKTVTGARRAGVARVIVVGGPDSEAFFVTELRRLDDIDWVFVSTEGDYATKVRDEVVEPRHHREEL